MPSLSLRNCSAGQRFLVGFACQWGIYELPLINDRTSTGMQLVSMIPFTRLAPIMAAVFGVVRA